MLPMRPAGTHLQDGLIALRPGGHFGMQFKWKVFSSYSFSAAYVFALFIVKLSGHPENSVIFGALG